MGEEGTNQWQHQETCAIRVPAGLEAETSQKGGAGTLSQEQHERIRANREAALKLRAKCRGKADSVLGRRKSDQLPVHARPQHPLYNDTSGILENDLSRASNGTFWQGPPNSCPSGSTADVTPGLPPASTGRGPPCGSSIRGLASGALQAGNVLLGGSSSPPEVAVCLEISSKSKFLLSARWRRPSNRRSLPLSAAAAVGAPTRILESGHLAHEQAAAGGPEEDRGAVAYVLSKLQVKPLRWQALSEGVGAVTPAPQGAAPVFLLGAYASVHNALSRAKGVTLTGVPPATLCALRRWGGGGAHAPTLPPGAAPDSWLASFEESLAARLPPKLQSALLPFQREGVRYGVQRQGRCLIADEMGVGKTIQAIALAAWYRHEGPLLVVCPAGMRLPWADELERWLPFLSPRDVHLIFGQRDDLPDGTGVALPKVVVVSYAMLKRLRASLARRPWGMVIVDESHNARTSKRRAETDDTQAMLELVRNTRRALLLSGTPSLTRPFDIFNQIDSLRPGLLGRNKYEFARHYCNVQRRLIRGRLHTNYSGGARLQELNVLLRQTVMVRRLKADVLMQLPPKRRQVIRLRLEPADISSAVTRAKEHVPPGTRPSNHSRAGQLTACEPAAASCACGGGAATSDAAASATVTEGKGGTARGAAAAGGGGGAAAAAVGRASEWALHACSTSNGAVGLAAAAAAAAAVGGVCADASTAGGDDDDQDENNDDDEADDSAPQSAGTLAGTGSHTGTGTGGAAEVEVGGVEDPVGGRRRRRRLSPQELGIAKLRGVLEWLADHPIFVEAGRGAAGGEACAVDVSDDDGGDDSGEAGEGQRRKRRRRGREEGPVGVVQEEEEEETLREGNLASAETETRQVALSGRGASGNGGGDTSAAAAAEEEELETAAAREKMVIFAHHHEVLDALQAFLVATGVEFVRFDGRTTPLDRALALRSFSARHSQVRVAIVGITAGGTGINLSAAESVVFAELPRTASDMLQAEDRCHRRGQLSSVNVYFFCAKDTEDEVMWQALSRSVERVSAAINGADRIVDGLEVDSVMSQRPPGPSKSHAFRIRREASLCHLAAVPELSPPTGVHAGEEAAAAAACLLPPAPLAPSVPPVIQDASTAGADPALQLPLSKEPPPSPLGVAAVPTGLKAAPLGAKIKPPGTDVLPRDTTAAGLEESPAPHEVYGSHRSGQLCPARELLGGEASGAETPEDGSRRRCLPETCAVSPTSPPATATWTGPPRPESLAKRAKWSGPRGSARATDGGSPASPACRSLKFGPAGSGVKAKSCKDGQVAAGGAASGDDDMAKREQRSETLLFEVSVNTGRVHVYVRAFPDSGAGAVPLGANFHPEELEVPGAAARAGEGEEAHSMLPLWRQRECQVAALQFLSEWKALRPVLRRRLAGRPLCCPLELELQRAADPAFDPHGVLVGGSKRRITPRDEVAAPDPDGSRRVPLVLQVRGNKRRQEEQVWSANEEPLCHMCKLPCRSSRARRAAVFSDLFCTRTCVDEYLGKTSSAYVRSVVFEMERGVCTGCHLDCHALVECARVLPPAQRRRYILQKAPAFQSHPAMLQRLVKDCLEGNAWHADHVVPVRDGGGECALENLRTLCVACHAANTAAQKKRWAAERRAAKEAQKAPPACAPKRANAGRETRAGAKCRIEDLARFRLDQVSCEEACSQAPTSGAKSSGDDSDLLGVDVGGSSYTTKDRTSKDQNADSGSCVKKGGPLRRGLGTSTSPWLVEDEQKEKEEEENEEEKEEKVEGEGKEGEGDQEPEQELGDKEGTGT